MTVNIESEFAVEMTCTSCSAAVTSALQPLQASGQINSFNVSLPTQSVTVSGSIPPSRILAVLRTTGKKTVLRGIQSPGGVSTPGAAAVCLFEHFPGFQIGRWAQHDNRGLARLIQIDSGTCVVDAVVDGLEPGTEYTISAHECGDISRGAESTGDVVAELGRFKADTKGRGEAVMETASVKVWEIIGRSLVVDVANAEAGKPSGKAICGIVARSAGVFENDKKVCSCSGQTLWEEAAANKL
ncbi:hypothetical protein HK102_002455 [Quaeritorhiza haematococci]|nr:hypothetical protein HK102_002455 [Quaeritorhiza haematococci]